MVFIPGGDVVLGEDNPTEVWHRPRRERTLDPFCIDRYEYPNRAGEQPRGDLGITEAVALCAEAGKRLCTVDEWERACRGTERRRYSYGNERDPKRCNTPVESSGEASTLPSAPSGSFAGCASPEGVYDLNGSLSEWVADPWPDHGVAANTGTEEAEIDPLTKVLQAEGYRTGATLHNNQIMSIRGGTMWRGTFYGQDCTSSHSHLPGERFPDDGVRCCR
jgi:formylglycine-generating enzyme required for sulfatase activity